MIGFMILLIQSISSGVIAIDFLKSLQKNFQFKKPNHL